MGLWGSLVALEVWDLSTPVQIRAAPLFRKNKTHNGFELQIPRVCTSACKDKNAMSAGSSSAAPFNKIQKRKCHQNQKKQNQQEDSEQDTDVQSELNLLMLNRSRGKNRNVLTVINSESKEFQKEFGNVQNAEKNSHQTYTI